MLALSQSFRMGNGNMEHNLRITKSGKPRQSGCVERRHLNEDLILFGNKFSENYVHNIIHNIVEEKIGKQLAEINEKHIRQEHPGKVRSIDEWIASQEYERNNKKKRVVREYIVQIGNKYTGISYVPETNEKNEIIDVNGNTIKEGDGRKVPAYKNGKVIESKINKKLKAIYKDFLQKFINKNPQCVVLSACIHSDELAGCHMHINCLFWSEKKNDVCFGLSETTAIRQQYLKKGIKCKNTKKLNAQNKWRKEMRKLLENTALEHGIMRRNMHNKKQYEPIPQFKKTMDKEAQLLDKEYELKEKEYELNKKETELVSNIATGEWYHMKKNHPDIYEIIHKEFVEIREKIRKNSENVLDKRTNVLYNSI